MIERKLIPNTFGLEVRAARWVEYHSPEELSDLIAKGEVAAPCLHVGAGSNLLFLGDYEGTVLHSCIGGLEVTDEDERQVCVRVGAGVTWDDWVAECVKRKWYGLENLSGIPGEVGAAAVQNIGAYGVEAKDLIQAVETIDIHGEHRTYPATACAYAYRDSLFKRPGMKSVFVTYVHFRLGKCARYSLGYGTLVQELEKSGSEASLDSIRQLILRIRNRKLPDPRQLGSAGSFFKNPVVSQAKFEELARDYPSMPHYPAGEGRVKVPAGWLIEQCGWKGRNRGHAGVYERQALVLVNRGGATGREIAGLAKAIQLSVNERFGISILPEVNFIG